MKPRLMAIGFGMILGILTPASWVLSPYFLALIAIVFVVLCISAVVE